MFIFSKNSFTLFYLVLVSFPIMSSNIVVPNEEKREVNERKISTDNKKVGRNEKCPCGSEKKYKHCCGSI